MRVFDIKKIVTNCVCFAIVLIGIIACSYILSYDLSDAFTSTKEDSYNESSVTFAVYIENGNGEYEEYSGTVASFSSTFSNMVYNESLSGCTDVDDNVLSGVLTYSNGVAYVNTEVTTYCTLYFYKDELTLRDALLLAEHSSSSVDDAITYIKGKGTPDFSSTATTDEGLYYAADDYGDSYYFRGAVEDNYVYFAGFYWQVIRINGDGSIRMIYDGNTEAYDNGTSSADRAIGQNIYASANGGRTRIQAEIEDWYSENLLDYEEYLTDTAFCEDYTTYAMLSTYAQYHAPYGRLYVSKEPVLTCSSYMLSVENGELNYPIFTISADEVSMAGGVYGTTNTKYYLYMGYTYWTSSPGVSTSDGTQFYIEEAGSLASAYSNEDTYYIRPVINLSSLVIVTSGDGTINSPYEVALS